MKSYMNDRFSSLKEEEEDGIGKLREEERELYY